jgi:hypothetical protein
MGMPQHQRPKKRNQLQNRNRTHSQDCEFSIFLATSAAQRAAQLTLASASSMKASCVNEYIRASRGKSLNRVGRPPVQRISYIIQVYIAPPTACRAGKAAGRPVKGLHFELTPTRPAHKGCRRAFSTAHSPLT